MKNNIKKKYIDEQIKEYSEVEGPKGLLIRHKRILSMVKNYSRESGDVLDVGCFDGKILKELEKSGYKNLYGVDFASLSSRSFKKNSINYSACDIETEKIPFKKKFDVIVFSDVLEHLFSPELILERVKKENLKSGGKIIFSVPNAGWFLNGILLTFFPSKLFSNIFYPLSLLIPSVFSSHIFGVFEKKK